MVASSPERGTFQQLKLLEQIDAGETTIEEATPMLELFKTMREHRLELEASDKWKINNMEYDLRSTEWICNKAKANEAYAQNLYAAICNNEFQKNEVWPRLSNKTWGASWRSAGGILADMRESGDYMDWYCSGIRNQLSDKELSEMTDQQKERYLQYEKNFVSESVVTDEIRADLFKLGWLVVDRGDE